MNQRCDFCYVLGENFYQQVTGWVAAGKRDSLSLREDVSPPKYACRACIKRQQLGVSAGQGTLHA